MRQRTGSLNLGTAKINQAVVCVSTPDIRRWENAAESQAFEIPIVGEVYYVRANIREPPHKGIWLKFKNQKGVLVPFKNPEVRDLGEPFFAYQYFDLSSRP